MPLVSNYHNLSAAKCSKQQNSRKSTCENMCHLNPFPALDVNVRATDNIQKIAVHAVLEPRRYLHELLFHVVFLIFCLEVRFVQYRLKKSDRLI